MCYARKRRFIAAVIFVWVFVVIGGWTVESFSAEPKANYGGTLRIVEQTDGDSIGYPAKLVRIFGYRQVAPAIEALFRPEKAGKPVPFLATNVKEEAKKLTITIGLRKGVKFHDETDFNAEAVKWNLEECMKAKTQGVEKFKSIDIVDSHTIRINLTEWDSTIISSLTQSSGMMISPTACKKNGEEWSAKNPVGTGPFQFVNWQKDVRTVYKRFPGYWQKGKPYLDGIEWIPVLDPLTREMTFRKGDADVLLTVAPKDVAALEKDGYVVNRNKFIGAMTLVPDSGNPKSPFADVRVRRAAQHAIDGNAIVKAVYQGEAEAVNQWIYKGHWGYNPSVVGYQYNPETAKKLLAEAGYPKGFQTKIMYRTNPVQDQVFIAVQGYLKAVGIEAELEPVQMGRYDQVAFKGGVWEGLIMNAVLSNPDLAGLLAQSYAGGGKAYVQMAVPADYGKAIQNAITAPDFKTKQKWTQEALKLMTDKYALQITLLCRSDFATSTKKVHNHNFETTPNNGFWTPEEAWMEK
jgi:peptide/nickel transport system substrate-binding protein